MNLKEFAALKAGDKVSNDMSQSSGEVTEVTPQGVRVRWGNVNFGGVTFLYTVHSTAWFHWSKALHVNVVDNEPRGWEGIG